MTTKIDGTNGIVFPDSTTQGTAGIGISQTWQNFTSSRALGTTYTNSTGRPIMIAVTAYNAGGSGDKAISFYINGSVVMVNGSFSSTGTPYQSGTLIIPDGATYQAATTGGVTLTLYAWWELR